MRKVAKGIRSAYCQNVVALLQEVPAWCKSNGYIYSSYLVLARADSDCGVLLPRLWADSIIDEQFGDYWCGVVVNNTIFISAHILDHGVEGGRADVVFEEALRYAYSGESPVPQSYTLAAIFTTCLIAKYQLNRLSFPYILLELPLRTLWHRGRGCTVAFWRAFCWFWFYWSSAVSAESKSTEWCTCKGKNFTNIIIYMLNVMTWHVVY